MGNPVLDNEENVKICLCPGCPTYKKSNLTNSLFCARGKAAEPATRAGCICPQCQVLKKYALDQMFYCIKGKSEDL